MTGRPLSGRRIVTTRDEPGRLDSLLAARGADVVHVPLIEIADAVGSEFPAALERLHEVDWVVVTSRHGAVRVVDAVVAHPYIRTAAVGTRTAQVLAAGTGCEVAVVPDRQTAADLVAAMPDPRAGTERVLVAQADRADSTLAAGLRGRGYVVETVVAYVTRLRVPTVRERQAIETADAVAFASGSAAAAWADAIGTWTPPHVVAIGPTTEAAAIACGLQVTAVAADHSVEGLADEVTAELSGRP